MTIQERKKIISALKNVNSVISPILDEMECGELVNVRSSLKLALGYKLSQTTMEILEIEARNKVL